MENQFIIYVSLRIKTRQQNIPDFPETAKNCIAVLKKKFDLTYN